MLNRELKLSSTLKFFFTRNANASKRPLPTVLLSQLCAVCHPLIHDYQVNVCPPLIEVSDVHLIIMIIIIMCIFIYRTYHLSSHGGLQFLLKGNQINIIQITNLQLSFYKSDQIKSNQMLVFGERGKPEYPGENLS